MSLDEFCGALNRLNEVKARKAFISGIFEDVTEGWQHAVDAVHVEIAEYLMPRFRE